MTNSTVPPDPMRNVDDFLADLDDVLATSTAPTILAPATEPEPEHDASVTMPDVDLSLDVEEPPPPASAVLAPAPAALSPREAAWWEKIYANQDADLDTHTGTAPAPAAAPSKPTHAPGDQDQDDVDKADDEAEPEPKTAADSTPAKTTAQPQKQPVPTGKTKRDASRVRVILFNGSAAGAGHAVGLVPLLGHALPAAEQAATGTVGLVLAAGGAVGAWKLMGLPAVSTILPRPMICRLLATVVTAEIGRRFAPAPVVWLNERGAAYGLGATDVSLLLTAAGMCGGLWWLIDRRTRMWWWGARWILRVPLASALLATALYAPGTTV